MENLNSKKAVSANTFCKYLNIRNQELHSNSFDYIEQTTVKASDRWVNFQPKIQIHVQRTPHNMDKIIEVLLAGVMKEKSHTEENIFIWKQTLTIRGTILWISLLRN